MQIDWLTVGAQVVNFLILVFLLKRFLYGPVINAMARREKRVAERLTEAEKREEDAAEKAAEYKRKVEAFENERKARVARAMEEAEHARRERLDAARAEIEAIEKRWRDDLAREQQDFVGSLRSSLAQTAEAMARRALADLAGADLESRIVEGLVERLAALDADSRSELARAAGGITVVTSFDLGDEARRRLVQTLETCLGAGVRIEWTTSPDLICGIRVIGGGRRIAWSIADYFEPLGSAIRDQLASAASPPGGS